MKSILIALLLSLALMLSAQGFKGYLPNASAAKAASYLAVIDSANSGVRTRRASVRSEMIEAETRALSAFALLLAAENGDEWADPEGTLTSSRAKEVFVEARAAMLRAASSLSSGSASTKTPGIFELETKRAEAAENLRKILKTTSLGLKSIAGIERILSERMPRTNLLFPEVIELQTYLRKAGSKGYLLSALALVESREDLVAAAYISETDTILSVAPAASSIMESLATAYSAYSAWVSGFPIALCPGMLLSSDIPEREPFAKALSVLASLDAKRVSSLITAMESGDGRDAAAASAARRLVAVWESLGAAQRRRLSLECSIPVSIFSSLASSISSYTFKSFERESMSPEAVLFSLNSLSVAIADQNAKNSLDSAEPSLILLEKPQLAEVARTEERFSTLFSICRGRLDAIHNRSVQETCGNIENLANTKRIAAVALGSVPVSLVVEAVDITSKESGLVKRIAFITIAKNGDGRIVRIPVKAEIAADFFAKNFTKAAGVVSVSGTSTAKILQKYGYTIVTAYDPARAGGGLALSSFPNSIEDAFFSCIDMEVEILERGSV
jgi:hypothetical protein